MSTLNPKPMYFSRYLKWFIFLSLLMAITAFALHLSDRVYNFLASFFNQLFLFCEFIFGRLILCSYSTCC